MNQDKEAENLINKIKNFKEADKVDLSSKEDLAIAVMNLIAIEEHLFYTYNKTNKDSYLDMLNEVREMRKKYLAQIVKDPEGEMWCISKHFLAASMRLMEVGTKKLNENKKEEAKDLFNHAYQLWNIFWGVNLKLVAFEDIKTDLKNEEEIPLPKKEKVSVFASLGKVVQKVLDCCRE